jgi:N4-(beta-N-acetylglucosaminyl)-L-asparaginase
MNDDPHTASVSASDSPHSLASRATRRGFFTASSLAATGLAVQSATAGEPQEKATLELPAAGKFPVRVISSANGLRSTRRAYQMILDGEDTLKACVAGVNIVEDDPLDTSVGYGGLPNEVGVVQLDSAVMHGPTHLAGGVACLENIRHPSRVAYLVMQQTDHVLLVGEGALQFAKAHGFREENLLTERARKIWLRWKQSLSDSDDWLEAPKEDPIDEQAAAIIRNRPTGTIHCAGMNPAGDISCVTTTSGLAFKIPGRVGDSPIIGAGLYVDNEIGSCGSTGRGEANLQNQCSFAAVELMGRGMSPVEAGLEVLRRVAKHTVERLRNAQGEPEFGLNFYLLRKDGEYGGVAMRGGKFAVTDEQGSRLEECKSLY